MTVSAFLVTSPLTKLLNAKWVTAVISIGLDGPAVAETLATKMFAYDSVEVAPDLLLRKSPNHVTNLASSLILVWSLSKILTNSDSSPVATTQPTLSTQMNFTTSKIKSFKVYD